MSLRHDGSLDALVGQAVREGRLSASAGEAWYATRGAGMSKLSIEVKELKSGNRRLTFYVDDEPSFDATVTPDGKTVTLGMDGELRSGKMPCSGGARPGWARFRFERLP